MYTLKIKWMRHDKGVMMDETTLFIPADAVYVHAEITSDEQMSAWNEGDFLDYRLADTKEDGETRRHGRLINVEREGNHTWYLASLAWLLGPDGKTIERLT